MMEPVWFVEEQCLTIFVLSGQCPTKNGFVFYRGACLKVSTARVSYDSAVSLCARDDAHLFEVKSAILDEERVRYAVNKTGKL